jgi:anti-sigma B factor antagonist
MASYAVEVRSAPTGRAVTVAVRGEIDLTVADDLLLTLTCAASTSGVPELVVDLDHVEFLDSSGISALVRAHTALAEAGTRMHVEGGPEQVRRVLSVSGVEPLLCPDLDPDVEPLAASG